jgi:GNAT superfamily N-acetyltransferase
VGREGEPIIRAMTIEYSEAKEIGEVALASLYGAVGWSSGRDTGVLRAALAGSHAVVTAWDGEALVGLGSTLSDGHLVVYYSHLLVHPDYQRSGIGGAIVGRLAAMYEGFHQHILVAAAGGSVEFYETQGFKVGSGTAMWQVGFEP